MQANTSAQAPTTDTLTPQEPGVLSAGLAKCILGWKKDVRKWVTVDEMLKKRGVHDRLLNLNHYLGELGGYGKLELKASSGMDEISGLIAGVLVKLKTRQGGGLNDPNFRHIQAWLRSVGLLDQPSSSAVSPHPATEVESAPGTFSKPPESNLQACIVGWRNRHNRCKNSVADHARDGNIARSLDALDAAIGAVEREPGPSYSDVKAELDGIGLLVAGVLGIRDSLDRIKADWHYIRAWLRSIGLDQPSSSARRRPPGEEARAPRASKATDVTLSECVRGWARRYEAIKAEAGEDEQKYRALLPRYATANKICTRLGNLDRALGAFTGLQGLPPDNPLKTGLEHIRPFVAGIVRARDTLGLTTHALPNVRAWLGLVEPSTSAAPQPSARAAPIRRQPRRRGGPGGQTPALRRRAAQGTQPPAALAGPAARGPTTQINPVRGRPSSPDRRGAELPPIRGMFTSAELGELQAVPYGRQTPAPGGQARGNSRGSGARGPHRPAAPNLQPINPVHGQSTAPNNPGGRVPGIEHLFASADLQAPNGRPPMLTSSDPAGNGPSYHPGSGRPDNGRHLAPPPPPPIRGLPQIRPGGIGDPWGPPSQQRPTLPPQQHFAQRRHTQRADSSGVHPPISGGIFLPPGVPGPHPQSSGDQGPLPPFHSMFSEFAPSQPQAGRPRR